MRHAGAFLKYFAILFPTLLRGTTDTRLELGVIVHAEVKWSKISGIPEQAFFLRFTLQALIKH